MERKVNFYRMTYGKCPVEEFLDSLPGKVAKKITWVLKLLEEFRIVPSLYFKKLPDTNNIWECRIKLGSDIYRIFAFFDGNEIILTHGIVKKKQKTPEEEIERAEKCKDDHFRREGGNNEQFKKIHRKP